MVPRSFRRRHPDIEEEGQITFREFMLNLSRIATRRVVPSSDKGREN